MIDQQKQSVRQFSDVFFIYIQQGDEHHVERMKAHSLKYVLKGEMEIDDGKNKHLVKAGECVFIRRDHRVSLRKYPLKDEDFQCITLEFHRDFLRKCFHQDVFEVPESRLDRIEESIVLLKGHPQLESLFLSMMPYTSSVLNPSEALMNLKLEEGILALLSIDERFFPTLFDFAESWKIDILDFMNENYMYNLSVSEIANYTGRSLATFKRDFAKISKLPPERWIVNKRLEMAYSLLEDVGKGVTDVAYEVGFKNRSHFTKVFKEKYGVSPTEVLLKPKK